MSSREQIDSVMRLVKSWPAEDRAALAGEILRDLERSTLAPTPRDTLSRARGLFKTASPAPTDEEVDRMVEDHLLQKYGGR